MELADAADFLLSPQRAVPAGGPTLVRGDRRAHIDAAPTVVLNPTEPVRLQSGVPPNAERIGDDPQVLA
jgi:hypothetical protein